MTPLRLPAAVVAMAGRGGAWATWVEGLPRLVGEVVEEWGLVPDGDPRHGRTSLVLPVRDADDRPAVLKLGCPDPDVEHEHLALRDWDGQGAVRLLRADPRRRLLLLERLHDEDLSQRWDEEACEVVAGLYAVLHRPAPPQLSRLSVAARRWSSELAALPRDAPLPRRLVEQAAGLAGDLASDPATDGTLVHGDLHYENVLAADRAPWLAIDPQPRSGDPHYEPAPMLWDRLDELTWPGGLGVRDGVRHRFHTLVDLGGLDEDRARAWVVVRVVVNALWELQDHPADPDRATLTASISVAKAVQD
ncbi:aminoglycoside phosphotransferase family protein [Nocardioides aequoreus]|uniref:aminoglycoside phosphotransferase family protein n=1 Tax=Nocardioides aequoreus TaxID=397278 RepID=UPI000A4F1F92|nr:aminoglycoside phosphotransferase family protein [Nocardioides aequoreus]